MCVKSVLWGPHYRVRLVLNIDSNRWSPGSSWWKSANEVITARMHSKKDRRRTKLRKPTQHFEDEARLKCVFEGKKPRCQDGQEVAEAACSQCASAVGFQEEAVELGHALET